RTAKDADAIVALALLLEGHGAASILLEAVPEEVAGAVIKAIGIPVIGCGAGNVCHASVIVTHDALGLTLAAPRFVPKLADLATQYKAAFEKYIRAVESGEYPGKEHGYQMIEEEKKKFVTQD